LRKGWVSKFALLSGELVRQVEVQEGARFHPGGLTLDGNSLWVPVAEYHRGGPTTVQRRNRETLALESSFEVKDHIGCVGAGPDYLIGGNWDSRVLYKWSKLGVQESARPNPRVTSYQDVKLLDGMLVGSGHVSATVGAVEWVRVSDLGLVRRVEMGTTDRGVSFMNEGMTIRGGKLFLLPEDDPGRLFVFVPGTGGPGGASTRDPPQP